MKTSAQLQKQFFYSLPYNIVIRDYYERFVEFTGDYENATNIIDVISSDSSSSKRNFSSNSFNAIFEEDMRMILSQEQIEEIGKW